MFKISFKVDYVFLRKTQSTLNIALNIWVNILRVMKITEGSSPDILRVLRDLI